MIKENTFVNLSLKACARETESPPVLAVSHSSIYHSPTLGIVLCIYQSIYFLPTLSFGCRGHYPPVVLWAYQTAAGISPKGLCIACKPFRSERCIILAPASCWRGPTICSVGQEHPVLLQLTQQSCFAPSEMLFSLLFPLFIHVWILWDHTRFSSIYTLKFTVLWWPINDFYS